MKRLRIFLAVQPGCVSIPGSQLWYANLYQPLVSLGHDVVPLQYDLMPHFVNLDPAVPAHRAFIEANRPKLEAALLAEIEAAHRAKPIDVFFSYFYSACARPETIRAIGAMGIRTVNWYCNGSYQFHLVKDIAPAYDCCLVPECYRLDDYRRAGARPIYCQEAANPDVYRPYAVSVEYDVTFVGQAYGDRPAVIRHLQEQGIDVRVWGPHWKHYAPKLQTAGGPPEPDDRYGGILTDEEMIRMYSRSKINLGFSSCGETHASGERILQVRLRDFEVPMSGGFYMVEYMEELEAFFEIGKEVICYTDADDLTDKIRYYLAHDAEREAIRRAGFERCRRDHTWQKRFEDVFRTIDVY
ncbi:MAG: glycosyltransferase [Phycisphaerae bacterium]|nr:glycosyltransferase [Phycisphaerae bacterium]